FSADGIGVLAPRGWHCEGVAGSSGEALFLSPRTIHHDPGSGWKGLEGAAIEIQRIFGGTFGRYHIPEIPGRGFPRHRTLAVRIMEGIDLALPSGPYASDSLKYISKRMVEYKTPARAEGLGNSDSWLKKNDIPITGVAILTEEPPDLLLSGVPDL